MIDAVPSRCFQGVVPSAIATVAPDGTPNVTFLSQVYRVDERHVALSCQFFNKTKRNVIDNPQATVVLYDPVTFEAYHLDLSYRHAEESGPLFDEMAMRIEAIASHTGMSGVFKLLSADVYEVERCEKVDGFIEVPDLPPLDDPGGRSELRTLQVVSQRACRATTLDDLFREVLASLDETLGFGHGMVLLPSGDKLRVEACRGYPEHVVGLEIEVGDGFIGAVAHQRRVMRVGGIKEDLRYGRAVRGRLAERGAAGALCREVPLLGLPDAQSALALPLEVCQRLVGVLALESRERLRFDDGDEAFLAVVANQVAACLDSLLLRSGPSPAGEPRRFRFFPQDDCVFVDDEYL
ncbi:MAG: GAF domain-containing protein, partial [Myxococcales bacterium]|nr:GAF domain-containing protein [Myxococcales bacterium]